MLMMLKQKKKKNYLRQEINYSMYLKRKHKPEYLREKKHSLFQGSR